MQPKNSALFLSPNPIISPYTGRPLGSGQVIERSNRTAYIASDMSGAYRDPRPRHLLEHMFGITLPYLHYLVLYLESEAAGIVSHLGDNIGKVRLVLVRSPDFGPEAMGDLFLRDFLDKGEVRAPNNAPEPIPSSHFR